MEVKYYLEEDVLIIIASRDGRSGGTLRDDFGVIFALEDEGVENITRIDLHRATRFLPLDAERGYDADTDTLTLGDKPDVDYRVVDNGDFVSYRQWFDDGSEWGRRGSGPAPGVRASGAGPGRSVTAGAGRRRVSAAHRRNHHAQRGK